MKCMFCSICLVLFSRDANYPYFLIYFVLHMYYLLSSASIFVLFLSFHYYYSKPFLYVRNKIFNCPVKFVLFIIHDFYNIIVWVLNFLSIVNSLLMSLCCIVIWFLIVEPLLHWTQILKFFCGLKYTLEVFLFTLDMFLLRLGFSLGFCKQ